MKNLPLFSLLLFAKITIPQVADRYDVVISEIFADPIPSIGLPQAEFIELRNVSGKTFNLRGWKISDTKSSSSIVEDFNLLPDSFVIVCPATATSAYAFFGATVGIASFPSINNDRDTIVLESAEGRIIHGVAFESGLHQNTIKENGGWSLELKDCFKPCIYNGNWTSSKDLKGGTPGNINSVDEKIADEIPPRLIAAYTPDSTTVSLVFDEALESTLVTFLSNYVMNNDMPHPFIASLQPPLFQTLLLQFSKAMIPGKTYDLNIKNIADCSGNVINDGTVTRIGLAVSAEPMDLVINEILFNPKPGGADYVELYHAGSKVVDASRLYIANKNSAGNITAPVKISEYPRLIFPGDYLVITEDVSSTELQYVVTNPSALLQIQNLPSLPDDEGTIVLLNEKGIILDELHYSEKWHFALINNNEGVSLERIEITQATQNSGNWHSASSDAGFGTPGHINSQFRNYQAPQGEISFEPIIFSPDNDGFNDVLTISYRFSEPGYVFNLTVFDAVGHPVRFLVKNGLCGTSGLYRWDGLGEENQKLRAGIYIMYSELFNVKGKVKQFKNSVVLARKLVP